MTVTLDEPAVAPAPPPAARPARRWAVEAVRFAVFVVAAVAATWPLARHLGTRVPFNLIDPLENVWIFGWAAHGLAHQPLDLFDANIFFPEDLTLAYAESMLGISLPLAPLFWLTGDAVLTTNVAAILLYAVSGWTVMLLVRELTGRQGPATVAGIAFAVSPYRVFNIVHLHLVATHLTPAVLLVLVRISRDGPTRRRLVALALLVAAQLWSSFTAGIVTAVVVGVWALWELARRRRAGFRVVAWPAAAVAAGFVLALPVLVPYSIVRDEHPEYEHPDAEVVTYSATPGSYLVPAIAGPVLREPLRDLGGRFFDREGAWEKFLFPGVWTLVAGSAAIVAAAVALARRRRPRPPWLAPAALAGGIGAVGFVMSLGPRWDARPDGFPLPYALVNRVVPGNLTRVPARFGVLVILALVVLGGLVLAAAPARLRAGLVLASLALVALEVVPATLPTVVPPPITAAHEAVASRDGTVLQLPTVETRADGTITGASLIREPVHLYLSTAHFRPMTNGYGAFTPTSAVRFLRRIQDLPSPAAMDALRERDVRTVVVQEALLPGTPWVDVVSRLESWPGVRLLARQRGVRVYDVSRAAQSGTPNTETATRTAPADSSEPARSDPGR